MTTKETGCIRTSVIPPLSSDFALIVCMLMKERGGSVGPPCAFLWGCGDAGMRGSLVPPAPSIIFLFVYQFAHSGSIPLQPSLTGERLLGATLSPSLANKQPLTMRVTADELQRCVLCLCPQVAVKILFIIQQMQFFFKWSHSYWFPFCFFFKWMYKECQVLLWRIKHLVFLTKFVFRWWSAKCFGFIVSIIGAKFHLFPFLSCGVLLIVFICLLYIRDICERFCEISS